MKTLISLSLLFLCACAHFDGFLGVVGAEAIGISAVTIYYIKHPSHPNCYKYVGPDTAVTHPVALEAIEGRLWGNECLSWDEERKLRHEY